MAHALATRPAPHAASSASNDEQHEQREEEQRGPTRGKSRVEQPVLELDPDRHERQQQQETQRRRDASQAVPPGAHDQHCENRDQRHAQACEHQLLFPRRRYHVEEAVDERRECVGHQSSRATVVELTIPGQQPQGIADRCGHPGRRPEKRRDEILHPAAPSGQHDQRKRERRNEDKEQAGPDRRPEDDCTKQRAIAAPVHDRREHCQPRAWRPQCRQGLERLKGSRVADGQERAVAAGQSVREPLSAYRHLDHSLRLGGAARDVDPQTGERIAVWRLPERAVSSQPLGSAPQVDTRDPHRL